MKADDTTAALRAALPAQDVAMISSAHRDLIAGFRSTIPHTITFVEIGEGTCGTYAFGVWNHPTYRAIAGRLDVYAGKKFFAWILPRLDELAAPEQGCLVAYFDDAGLAQHVGHVVQVREGYRVRSKWGEMPLYEHGLFEVPTDYGDQVRFYGLPALSDVMARFEEFAREQANPAFVDALVAATQPKP